MNRRTFLTRVCGGIVGAAVLSKLPLSVLPTFVQRKGALDYLLKEYRQWCDLMAIRRREFPTVPVQLVPTAIVTSRWLFEAAENELLARNGYLVGPCKPYISAKVGWQYDCIVFKNATLTYSPDITCPMEVNILDSDQWLRFLGAQQHIPGRL